VVALATDAQNPDRITTDYNPELCRDVLLTTLRERQSIVADTPAHTLTGDVFTASTHAISSSGSIQFNEPAPVGSTSALVRQHPAQSTPTCNAVTGQLKRRKWLYKKAVGTQPRRRRYRTTARR
jgi:hypothetical protein